MIPYNVSIYVYKTLISRNLTVRLKNYLNIIQIKQLIFGFYINLLETII